MAAQAQIKTFDVYVCPVLGGEFRYVAIPRWQPGSAEPPGRFLSHFVELAWSEAEAIERIRAQVEGLRGAIRSALADI
jgi:hypothetical protein